MQKEERVQILFIRQGKLKKYTVTLQGGNELCLHEEAIIRGGLEEGAEVSLLRLEELYLFSQQRFAHERALNLLSVQQTTEKRLLQKLLERFEPEIAQETVERMKELHLLDDAEYAKKLAYDLYHLRHLGERRILSELLSRGIEYDLAQETVSQLDFDSSDRITDLVRRRYGGKLQEEKGRRRAVDGLLRMGYRYDEIRSAIRTVLEEEADTCTFEENAIY